MDNTILEFNTVLDHLIDVEHAFPPSLWNQFSDLSFDDVKLLKEKWNLVSPQRKVTLLQDLASLMDYDFQVNFDDFAKFCMNDDEPLVRTGAIRLLFEYDHKDMIDPMLDVLENDADEEVQATAATMLGNYVYKGELEELNAADKKRVEEALLRAIDDSNAVVLQRRALEAVSYSSREEVNPLILAAYEKIEKEWKITALFSMGRSANRQWEKIILHNLDSDEPDIQFEAIGAAGEMYLESALPKLIEIAENGDELEQPIRMAIARALENIGGVESISILTRMLEWTDDDEEVELIEQAIEYASFTNAVKMPDMFGFSMDEMGDAIGEYLGENEEHDHDHSHHHHHHDHDDED